MAGEGPAAGANGLGKAKHPHPTSPSRGEIAAKRRVGVNASAPA
jgi:hypothetical protein